jgi:hypothetical protein
MATHAKRAKGKRRRRAPPTPPAADVDCLSVAEFCRRNGISKPFYYKLRDQGLTPDEIRLGARVLITREAAEQWRRDHARASKRSACTTDNTASP